LCYCQQWEKRSFKWIIVLRFRKQWKCEKNYFYCFLKFIMHFILFSSQWFTIIFFTPCNQIKLKQICTKQKFEYNYIKSLRKLQQLTPLFVNQIIYLKFEHWTILKLLKENIIVHIILTLYKDCDTRLIEKSSDIYTKSDDKRESSKSYHKIIK